MLENFEHNLSPLFRSKTVSSDGLRSLVFSIFSSATHLQEAEVRLSSYGHTFLLVAISNNQRLQTCLTDVVPKSVHILYLYWGPVPRNQVCCRVWGQLCGGRPRTVRTEGHSKQPSLSRRWLQTLLLSCDPQYDPLRQTIYYNIFGEKQISSKPPRHANGTKLLN